MLYWVMLDHEQSGAQCASLASARATARRIRDAEPLCLVRNVSIYSEDETWIEDVTLALSDADPTRA